LPFHCEILGRGVLKSLKSLALSRDKDHFSIPRNPDIIKLTPPSVRMKSDNLKKFPLRP
jgi:hypothetical protein